MKKLVGIILVLCLMFSLAGISLAVTEDPEVLAAYNDYKAIETALTGTDYDALKAAVDGLDEKTMQFSDEENEEWNRVVEEEVGLDAYFETVVSAATIIYAADTAEAFSNDPNAGTAMEFMGAYSDAKAAGLPVDEMKPELIALYTEAEAYLPTDNVLKVYEAFYQVTEAVSYGDIEELKLAAAGYEEVLDVYENLSEEELEQLSELFGLDGAEDAKLQIDQAWETVKNIIEVVDAYEAYLADENPEKAKALIAAVDKYDELTNGDRNLIGMFYADIDDAYALAEETIANGAEDDGKDESDDSEKEEGAPKTGDETMLWPVFTMMGSALLMMAAYIALKKCKNN